MAIKTDARAAVNKMDSLVKRARGFAMIEAIEEFADEEMDESQKLVPVDTGELKDSKYRAKAQFRGNQLSVALGYMAEHAAVVHEDMEAFHRVGQAKYLEQPLNESAPHMTSRVADKFMRKMGD